MKKIVVELEIRDEDLQELEKNSNDAKASMDALGDSGKDAGKDIFDGIGKSNPLIEKLDSLTNGAVSKMIDLSDAAKKAGVGMRSAFIASGIGAAVVAIGLIVAYWDEIVDLVNRVNERLQEQLDLNRSNADILESEISLINKKIDLLTKEGKTTEALQKQKIELVKQAQLLNEQEVKILERQLVRLKATETELSLWEKIKLAAAQTFLGVGGAASQTASIAAQRIKEINEIEQAILEAKNEAVDLDIVLFDALNPEEKKGKDKKRDKVDRVSKGGLALGEQDEVARAREREAELTRIQGEALQQRLDEQEQNARRSVLISELQAQAQLDAANFYSDGLAAVSRAIGKETVAGKVAAVAAAGISTYLSAQKAYQSQLSIPTPDAPIRAALAAGVAITTGLANVKKILSVKVPGGGGGLGSSIPSGNSFSGGSIPQPSFRLSGAEGVNQIGRSLGEQLTDNPLRAFVVNGDIKKANDIENNSIQQATV